MAIETLSNPTPADSYYTRAIAEGYIYECSCGEMYNNADAAYHCRKCRNYCVFGYCTHVTDVRTNKVVLGRVPTREELSAAMLEAAIRWEEERLELAQWMAEDEAAREEEDREEELRELEETEEEYWELQDKMSGVK